MQTLWCGNMVHDQFVQVTSSAVLLIDCGTTELTAEWRPSNNGGIVVAAANASQV